MSQTVFWQRVEGLVSLLVSVVLYAWVDGSWWLFALLLLAPDLSMLGYLLDRRSGQAIYNVVHTYALPLWLGLAGFWLGHHLTLTLGLIWLAHIGMDRAAGYGLKEAAGFHHTHLGMVGQKHIAPRPAA